ncbi:MAG: hypothetical protein ABEI52_01500 [Halobacteriaceae archaeon]
MTNDSIESIASRARSRREEIDVAKEPRRGAAVEALKNGLWPVLKTYIDARAGNRQLTPSEAKLLERALNDWLAIYCRHHGHRVNPSLTVREAASMFVDTHDLYDTAQLLTGIPQRHASA